MDVKLAIPLKYLTNFWRTLEIPLSNCVINLNLICFAVCVTATGAARFAVTATRLYVPVVTLSTQDNTKLLQQLKSGFKRTSNWDKYQLKMTKQAQNPSLDYVIDPSLHRVNRLLVLSFKTNDYRKAHTGCFLPKVEIMLWLIDKAFLLSQIKMI